VCFLASDRAQFITAQAYAIDGGMTQVMPEAEAFPAIPLAFTDALAKR
jgi:hypothetical protein